VALGLHLEGPFLAPERPGAHPPEDLRVPVIPRGGGEIEAWIDPRWVRLVTLAPELPGALELIAALVERGIRVGLGHSNATYVEAELGIEAGARWTTHLFSAMRELHHREPGIAGAALADSRVRVALIPDGIHVHPALLSLVARLKGPEGVTLISDGMAASGMPPGRYNISSQDVIVDKTSARLADGRLAGSVILLDDAVRGMVKLAGRTRDEALRMATQTPAQALGLDDRGRLAPGCRADLAAFAPDLQVEWTAMAGEVVYRRAAW
jgi:N-acetylglucosamine-6-phosphate deacetylase